MQILRRNRHNPPRGLQLNTTTFPYSHRNFMGSFSGQHTIIWFDTEENPICASVARNTTTILKSSNITKLICSDSDTFTADWGRIPFTSSDDFRNYCNCPRWLFKQDDTFCLQPKREMGQGIFRDKTALGERRREDSWGFKKLFVSSPRVIKSLGIMVTALNFFFCSIVGAGAFERKLLTSLNIYFPHANTPVTLECQSPNERQTRPKGQSAARRHVHHVLSCLDSLTPFVQDLQFIMISTHLNRS